jgi:ankyrin repeat protein
MHKSNEIELVSREITCDPDYATGDYNYLLGIYNAKRSSPQSKNLYLLSALTEYIQKNPTMLNQSYKTYKATPLQIAAALGNEYLVSFLLGKKIDPNFCSAQDTDNDTPLLRAAGNNQSAVMTLLLQNKADPNLSNSRGRTALWYAVLFNNAAELSPLIETYQADPTLFDKDGNTPLHIAAQYGYTESITALLASCKDENQKQSLLSRKNFQNRSPQDIAIFNNHDEAAVQLQIPDRLGQKK